MATKLAAALASIPDRTHGPWWRYMVANHDTVAAQLRTRSMPDVLAAIGQLLGKPPITRQHGWTVWRSAQAHVQEQRRYAPVWQPQRRPRPKPAQAPAPEPAPVWTPPAPATGRVKRKHSSEVMGD